MDRKEYLKQYRKNKYNTKSGRANILLNNYRKHDKDYGYGETTLTADWIVENIFSGQKCVYCGESDWKKLGCDRIDDSLPHTPENCQPCCPHCNKKKTKQNRCYVVFQYDKEGNFIKEWSSTTECEKDGFDHRHVSECCRGKLKTHKGFIWSYIPLFHSSDSSISFNPSS